MSFICGSCGNHQGSGSKPIRVIDQQVEKIYRDPLNSEIILGVGHEIVKESNICGKCAGVKVGGVPTQTFALPSTPKGFEFLPNSVLSSLIEQPLYPPMKSSLISVALESFMARSRHNRNSGAKRDIEAAMVWMGPYAKRGGGLN